MLFIDLSKCFQVKKRFEIATLYYLSTLYLHSLSLSRFYNPSYIMHLLEPDDNGGYRLTKKLIEHEIPRYAILSHTWGSDDQEFNWDDVTSGVGKDKNGYEKIQFCGNRATYDHINYFWVDSCCINKSSDAELSESLNSMFCWYKGAAKCYVYLSDVFAVRDGVEQSQSQWEPSFRASRWFTRGWTLQELLAPVSVEFFSRDGKRLGDKESLKLVIQDITRIATDALQGIPLARFSVTDRKKWAEKRITTRQEDAAYSMLGIFGVSMPVIYGEGKDNAFRRLECEIQRLLIGKISVLLSRVGIVLTFHFQMKTQSQPRSEGSLIHRHQMLLAPCPLK
jgi:hypothetical protein